MEKTHKQTIEKMESDHNVKLKEETRRIKAEQEREYHKFLEQLKHKKKEVHLKRGVINQVFYALLLQSMRRLRLHCTVVFSPEIYFVFLGETVS